MHLFSLTSMSEWRHSVDHHTHLVHAAARDRMVTVTAACCIRLTRPQPRWTKLRLCRHGKQDGPVQATSFICRTEPKYPTSRVSNLVQEQNVKQSSSLHRYNHGRHCHSHSTRITAFRPLGELQAQALHSRLRSRQCAQVSSTFVVVRISSNRLMR